MNLPHLPALKTNELNFVISFLYSQNFTLLSTDKTSTEILSTDNVRTKIKGCRFLCENRLNSLLFVFQRQFRFWWRKLRMPIMKASTLQLVRFHSLGVHIRKVSARFCIHSCNDAFLSADYEVKYCNFWDRGQSPRKLPFKWNLFGSTFAWRYLFFSILQLL